MEMCIRHCWNGPRPVRSTSPRWDTNYIFNLNLKIIINSGASDLRQVPRPNVQGGPIASVEKIQNKTNWNFWIINIINKICEKCVNIAPLLSYPCSVIASRMNYILNGTYLDKIITCNQPTPLFWSSILGRYIRTSSYFPLRSVIIDQFCRPAPICPRVCDIRVVISDSIFVIRSEKRESMPSEESA